MSAVPTRFVTFAVAVVVAVSLALFPVAAPAAVGTISTSALGARVYIGLLNNAIPIDLTLPLRRTWTTGGSASTASTAVVDLLPPLLPNLVYVGAITATAAPATGGGSADSQVAGLKLINNAVAVDALSASCQMTSAGISTSVTVANLKIGGQSIVNPAISLAVGVPGVLTATVNKRAATWDPATGRLDYTVRALDIDLLSGLAVVASGSVVAGEATCSGIAKLGTATTTPVSVAPGQSGTPVVTVTNTGDIATPGTVIKVPKPPSAYTLDPAPTVTGGGTCSTTDPVYVICSDVTVPGGGSVQVSLPVKVAASLPGTPPNWVATAADINVTSTPITGTAPTITITGSGTLVNGQPRSSTGGSVTITPTMLYAGKTATTNVTVTNVGPSDAAATVTIPLGAKPAGITVTASAGGTPCTVGATDIVCTGVTVAAAGSATVDVQATAPVSATVGTTWDLTGVTASLNGTVVSGSGRLLTIGDPDVYLKTVTLTPATATPGGAQVTPTFQVANFGVIAANPTTITIPAAPAGYTVGTVTTSGGGTCTATGCTGVTVPANGSVTVSVPVTLSAAVTANWTGQVSATAGGSTGTATGTLVTAAPQSTLHLTATGPSAGTVLPGQTTTMALSVDNLGPSNAVQTAFDVFAPANSTWGSLTGNPCVAQSATTARCTVDLTAGGPAVALSFPLVISALANPAVAITGGCADLDLNTTCDATLPSITLRTPLASLLTTTTGPATITPGQSGTATVSLTSLAARTGVQVDIPKSALPTGFTVTGASVPGGTCSVGPTTVTCSGFALVANTAKSVSLTVAVASSVTPPLVWTVPDLTVTASGETVGAAGTLASAGPVSIVLGATVDQSADRTIEPAGVLVLGLDLRNTGPSDAPAAVFKVAAPTGTTFGAVAAPCTATASLLTCTTALLAGASTGRFTVPLNVAANADPDTPIPATCVDLDGTPGCTGGDVSVPAANLKVPFTARATIAVTAADVTPGDSAAATVRVTAPRDNLVNLRIAVPLAALPGALSVTGVTGPAGATCGVVAGEAVCSGFTLTGGAHADMVLTVAAPAGATGTVTWAVTGILATSGGESVAIDRDLARLAAPQSTLTAAVVAPTGDILPGGTDQVAVTIDNTGPSDAVASVFTVVAPGSATFGTAPAGCTRPDATHITCTLNLTVAAAPVTYSIPVIVDAAATPAATLTGGCVQFAGVCATTIPGIHVGTPLALLLTTVAGPATITPGQSGTATVALTSLAARTGVQVDIPKSALPTGFTVTGASVPGGTCSVGPTTVTCSGFALAANTPKSVSLTVAVASSVTPPLVWTVPDMTVTAGGETAGAAGTLASAGPVSIGLGATVDQSADRMIEPGGVLVLGLDLRNTGPSDAPGAVFMVAAPAGTSFGAVAAPCTATASLLTCTTSLVTGASTGRFAVPLNVAANADPDIPIPATCVDLDGTPGCTGGDVSVPAVNLKVPFTARAVLSVTTADVTPGDSAAATVRVTALRDSLPGLRIAVPLAALPGALTVTGVTGPAGATCGVVAGEAVCSGFTLAGGGTADMVLTVAAPPGATGTVTWAVTGILATSGGESVAVDRDLARLAAARSVLTAAVVAPSGDILPGGTDQVDVTVDNTGPSDAVAAVFTVVAPGSASFGTAPAGCTRPNATHLTCTLDLTVAAAPVTYSIPVIVDPAATPASTLTGGCVQLAGVCATTIPGIHVGTPLSLLLTTVTGPATITPGHSGTATVTLTSLVARTGVQVEIPKSALPAGFTVTGASVPGGTCSVGPTTVTCSGFALAANTPKDVSLTVAVASSVTPPLVWTVPDMTVTSSGETAGAAGTLAVAGPVSTGLGATVDLPADGTIEPGGVLDLGLDLRNTGPSDAPAAVFTVVAPTGTSFGAAPAPCTATAALLTCTKSLVAGASTGRFTVPLNVAANADPDTPIPATCVDLNGTPGCGAGDVAVPAVTLKVPFAARAVLSVTVADVTPGDSAVATVRVTAPRDSLTGLRIAVPLAALPGALTVTGVTGPAGATCGVVAGEAVCSGFTLAGGGTADLALTLAAPPAATGTVTWAVTGIRATSGGESVAVDRDLARLAAPQAALTAMVVAPTGEILPGGTDDVVVTVDNTGPSDAVAAVVTAVAPLGASFGTAPAGCTRPDLTHVTCTFDLTVAAAPVTYTIPFVVDPAATPASTLTGGCVQLAGVCATTIPGIHVGTPLALLLTTVTGPATITPGQSGTATVTLTSLAARTGVQVDIPKSALPTGFTVTGASVPGGTCSVGPATVSCSGFALAANNPKDVSLTIAVAPAVTPPLVWTVPDMTVTSSGETAGAAGILASAGPVSTGLGATVDQPADRTIEPGGVLDLGLDLRNTGPSDAPAAVFTVVAPAGTSFGTVAAPCTAAASLLTCTTSLLAGASTGRFTVPLNVAANADPDTPIPATCVDLNGTPGCGAGDVSIPAVNLKVPFAARAAISVTAADVTPGDSATATVHVAALRDNLVNLRIAVPLAALPGALTVTGVSGPAGATCAVAAGEAACSGFTLSGGATTDLTLTVAAPPGATGTVTWAVTGIRATSGGESVAVDRDLARLDAARSALTAAVVAPSGEILPGGTDQVEVTVDNTGPSDAVAAVVTVVAPADVSFGTAPAGCTRTDPTHVTCTLSLTVAAAPVTYTIPVIVDPAATPAATLTGGCVQLAGVCATSIPAIHVGIPLQQRLTVTTHPDTVVPGTTGTARIDLTSTTAEHDLTVTVPTALPAGLAVTGVTVAGGTCTTTVPIVCSHVDLPTAGITIGLAALPSAPPATWTVTVDVADGTDPATALGHLATVDAPQSALTVVSADGPADGVAKAGGLATVDVVVRNDGPSDATGRPVTATAPAGTTFAANPCAAVPSVVVSCPVTLAFGASTTLSLPVLVPASADPLVTLVGGCVAAAGTPGCTPIRDIVLEVPLDRRATIAAVPAAITPGTTENVEVTVAGTNLTGVTLAVPLPPAGFTLGAVTASGAGTCTTTATTVDCTWAATSLGRITLPISVPAGAVPGTTWTATGIRAADSTGDLTVNRALATVDPARIALGAVVAPITPILPGGTGTVTFTLANTGPSDATGAPVGVILPAGVTFGTRPAGCSTGVAGRTTCPVTVPDGATGVAGPILPILVSATADPTAPLTGGCVDLDDDGTCTATDVPLAVPMEMPFDRRAAVQTAPVFATGDATIVLTSVPPVNDMRMVVPLAGLPAGVTAGPGPGCTADATEITCDDLDGGAVLTVPVTMALNAPAGGIWAPLITVTGPGGGSIAVSGILAQVGPPLYALGVTVPVPAAGDALRGDTVDLIAIVANTGGAVPGLDVPVTVRAPTGTTFGTLDAGTDADCDRTSATTLDCAAGVGTTGPVATWTLPVVVPVAPASATITGGCFDLDGDAACETPIADFVLGAALAAAITVASVQDVTVTPGGTGTATLTLHATGPRDRTTVTLDTTGLPAGLTVSAADLGGTPCTASCPFVAGTLTVTLAAAPDATEGDTWTPAITLDRLGDSVRLTRQLATVGAPDAVLAVDVDPPADDTVRPGTAADVRVTVRNTGISLSRGVPVEITAPAGTAITGTPCPRDSAVRVTCAADIPAGGSVSFTVRLTVGATATPGARMSGGCVDPGATGSCAGTIAFTLATSLAQRATLTLDPADLVPGDAATAYLTMTADRPLTGLTAAIPVAALPAGFQVVGAAGPAGSTCDLTGPIVCTGVDAPAGASHLITLRLRAGAAMAAAVSWAPTVTVTDPDGDTTGVTATLARTLAARTDVRWNLPTPAGTVAPGGTATLTASLHNAGISDATAVAVRLTAPAGATFGPADPHCLPVGGAQFDCTLDLPAGGAPLTLTIPVRVPDGAAAGSTLTGGCLDLGADAVCDAALPDLHVTPALLRGITANTATITPGETGTVTLTVDTTAAAPTVTIPTNALPAGMTVTPPSSCTTANALITCVGTTVALDVAVAADAALATWTPVVTVADAGRSSSAGVTVARVGAARIATTVGVAGPAAGTIRPGGTGTITVTVANAGPSRAAAWAYTVVAPLGLTFGPVASCTPQGGGTRLDCVTDIAAGDRVRIAPAFTVSPAADPATPLTGGCVLVAGNCTAIPDIALATPIAIAVTPGSTPPGGTATASVRITGSARAATLVVPLADLPAGFTASASATGCAATAAEIRCTGLDLPATVAITARTASGALPGRTWSAGVTVTAGTETAIAVADLIATTDRVAAVRYRFSGLGGTVTAGDVTELTVTATNDGPSDAVRNIARLTAPAGTRFGDLSGRAAQDCTVAGPATLTCTYDLARDADLSWTVPLTVAADATGRLAAACVLAAGTTTCGTDLGVTPSIARTGTLTVAGAVIPAGTTGTTVIRMSATVAHSPLALTVPLDALPAGVTVTAADLGDTACAVGTAVTCTDLALAADTPRELRLTVAVGTGVSAGTTWPATGITLANGDDKLVTAGVPVSTSAGAVTRSVTVGTPSLVTPTAGQTTVLPISIAGRGSYQASIVLPANTRAGQLPAGCRAGPTTSIVICAVQLPARLDLPLLVPEGTGHGVQIVGGCVDAALAGETPDGDCDDDADVPLPPLVVGRYAINLTFDQAGAASVLSGTKPVQVRVPYRNEGIRTAENVRFTVVPPIGVTVRSAAILFNPAAAIAATAVRTVAASCTTAGAAVLCAAPDAPALKGHELWLTLATTGRARSGTHLMRVTITTSSDDGNATDNTVEITLRLAGTTGGNLAMTGSQVTGLAALASVLLAVGFVLVAGSRRPTRRPVAMR
ncbi:hypothetical protein BJ973_004366 [Actinoplanes tereljensis]|uniref:Uncharacterized protein n=1 Tax=Paractinoplanes tereljensis TaxID=571912 RepID=A0A919NRH7_9ACTN|nr:hypothetical protein [Actinoplanes tereljensis]GIF23755.1 hypothetical protein Ate02nite_64850 [Actinoplanes tereljensis]